MIPTFTFRELMILRELCTPFIESGAHDDSTVSTEEVRALREKIEGYEIALSVLQN